MEEVATFFSFFYKTRAFHFPLFHCSADARGSNSDAARRTAATSSPSTSSRRRSDDDAGGGGRGVEVEVEGGGPPAAGVGGGESTLPAPSTAERNALRGSTTRLLSAAGSEGGDGDGGTGKGKGG